MFVGAGIGGTARHAVNRLASSAGGFPWNTVLVNVTGSLAIGLLAGKLLRATEADLTRALLVTGLVGGYTTFSAFALETVTLWERGARIAAVGYVGGSLVLSIAGAVIGLALTR